MTTNSFEADTIFESSSTTGKGISKRHVKSLRFYTESFTKSFENCFGNASEYCHLALLPSYLERENSSLVYQIDHFIRDSKYPQSGFYLSNLNELAGQIAENEDKNTPTILWGVTFALIDFAEKFGLSMQHTSVIETGGMKGRRKEIVREELHGLLKKAFDLDTIGGEYGMTELMSQAYAREKGVFQCPPWMRVIGREINDPFSFSSYEKTCALNIIDLANLDACCFIETSDIGKIYKNGTFEVMGRLDNSDTRGCNLLV